MLVYSAAAAVLCALARTGLASVSQRLPAGAIQRPDSKCSRVLTIDQ